MYYDINLKSNRSEPSKVDSLPSFSPSYSPRWWWLGCPPTQWCWGIGLPGQAVEACHQAQDRLSLAEERPNTTGSSLAAKRKAFRQTYLSQPFARKSRLPLRQYRNYPDPYHHPLSMSVFGQSFVRQFVWRRVISKYCFTFQLLWDKKMKKTTCDTFGKLSIVGAPESSELSPLSWSL